MSVLTETGDQFLMEDTDNTIGTNPTESATKFPTLYVNTSTYINTSFYDLPGFQDTRGMEYGIATTYAIKGVVDKTERVKIIVLIDYDSVKTGGSRDGFTNLLRSISNFVTDINKFRNSIAIIVSKVPKYVNNNEVTDKQVIEYVAKFIAQVKPILQRNSMKNSSSDEEKTYCTQALHFISIILERNNNDYAKIGLFRFPDKTGPFSDISLVQKGQERVRKIIYEQLNFTTIAKNDFNYVISDTAKINVNEIAQEINRNIIASIEVIGEKIKLLFSIKEKITNDITKLDSEINLKYDKLWNAQVGANNSNLIQCVELVEESTFNLHNFSTIKSYAHFSSFLNEYINTSTRLDSFNCFNGLKVAMNYLENSQKWYKFLLNMYDDLSHYDIQKDITLCRNAVSNFNVRNDDNETLIKNKLKLFFEQCLIHNHEYNHIKDVKLDDSKVNALNKLLNYTLRYFSYPSCDPDTPNKLVLRGYFVKFSDIVNTTVNCSERVEIMEVFAFNKVFIDASLNKTGAKVQLSILAPIWDIQGEQNITISGSPGSAHLPTEVLTSYSSTSLNGADGKSGLPSTSVVNFLGIGATFTNAQKLTISVNGGDGGPGQDGGDGRNGLDGIKPKMLPSRVSGVQRPDPEKDTVQKTVSSRGQIDPFHHARTFEIYGKDCTSGGNGGSGGEGGYGGQPSAFFISLLDNVKIPNISSNTGKRGPGGRGGQNGKAGKAGKMITVEETYFYHPRSPSELSYSLLGSSDLSTCEDGKSGTTGYVNRSNEESKTISFSIFIPIINNYKNYFREYLMNDRLPINETFLEYFYNSLESNTHKYYDTSGFIQELYDLEHQFNRLRKKKTFLSFYKSLLKRINQYEGTERESKVLKYLRTAILSKICIIDNNLDEYLVINVEDYLQNSKENILSYTKTLKQVTINNHEERFKSMLNVQITRANTIIMEHMLPDIDNIIDQTDNAIRWLIEEAENLKTTAEENEHKVKNNLQNLKMELIFRHILGVIQVGSVFLAFAGPAGAAAGAIIGGTSTVIQTFASDNSALPAIVHKQNLKFIEVIKKQQQQLLVDISVAERELDKSTTAYSFDNLNDIKQKLAQKRAELDTAIAGRIVSYSALQDMNDIRANITELLNNKITLLKGQQSKTDVQINNKLNVLNSITTVINAGEVAADVYGKIQTHKAKIDTVSDELKNLRDYIDDLKRNEQEIYNSMIPVIKDIFRNSNNLSQTSSSDLDVRKWKLQSKVKDLQFQIQQMTDKFTVKDDVKHCILQFESAITTMIRIYDRIQGYTYQSQLATYIKDVNSEGQSNNDIAKLELIIKSNLVMEEYEKGINAFKQNVFPFAYLYLDKFDFLSNETFQDLENITLLVGDAANQIQNLRNELKKENTIINEKYHEFQHFNVDFTGENSFYTWTYNEYKEDIIKLLHGHAVVFKSDVKLSRKINVIKFNAIGISFKCANNITQRRLNTHLMEFDVNMTHLGDSCYRFKDKFYSIVHKKVAIVRSVIEKTNNGTYTDETGASMQIRQNKPLLSPYTSWKIKLEHKKNYEIDDNFSSLLNYTNEMIDLVLEGHGSYIQTKIPMSNANVEKYYASFS